MLFKAFIFAAIFGLGFGQQCHEIVYVGDEETVHLKNPSWPRPDFGMTRKCIWTFYPKARGGLINVNCSDVAILPPNGLQVIVNAQTAHYYISPFVEKGQSVEIHQIGFGPVSGRLMCTIDVESCQCGRRYGEKAKIVGGVEPSPNEYPPTAALINTLLASVHGGAAIIGPRVALTSASTIYQQNPLEFTLLVGGHKLTPGTETNATRVYIINAFITHEEYVRNRILYDVGLIITETPIEFSARVGPSCLPYSVREDLEGSLVEVLGWGPTKPTGMNSDTLQVTALQVVPPENCEKEFKHDFSRDQQLCLKWPRESTCRNDVGGPMYYTNAYNNRLYSVGVISSVGSCEGLNVGPKVSYFLDWINEKVPSANFCVK